METLTAEEMYKLMDDELINCLGWGLQLNQKTAELENAEEEARFLGASLIEAGYAQGKIEGKNAEERARRETIWLHEQEQYALINERISALKKEIAEIKLQENMAAERLRTLYGIARLRAAELTAISKEE